MSSRWRRAQQAETTHPTHGQLSSYEQASERFAYFDHEIDDFFDTNLLAIGGGTGVIHRIPEGQRLVSIDPITSDKTEILEESQAELVTGAGEFLPFDDCSFDTVLCYNVLDHTANPDAVVEEAFRILNTGGEFLLMLNIYELPELIRTRLSVLDRPHPHHFDADELLSLLTERGFQTEVANHEKATLSDYALSQFTLKRIVASILLRWERIWIIGEKK